MISTGALVVLLTAPAMAAWQKGPEANFRRPLNAKPMDFSGIQASLPPPGRDIVIPEAFDVAVQWPQCSKAANDVRDTGNCACGAWATPVATSLSMQLCIATNGVVQVPLSSQDVCFNANFYHSEGCDGGNLGDPYHYIMSDGGGGAVTGGNQNGTGPFGSGWCSGYGYMHCGHGDHNSRDPYPKCPPDAPSQPGPTKCDPSAEAPNNDFSKKYSFTGNSIQGYPFQQLQIATTIQQSIIAVGPATTSFTVFPDFFNYTGGVYKSQEQGQPLGGLAVSIVGWGVDGGVDYWKAKNAWNTYWGENGFFRIVRGINHLGFESGALTTPYNATWNVPSP